MRMAVAVLVLMLLIAAPASGRLRQPTAQRYGEDRFAILITLYGSPTPGYTFGRCRRAAPDKFRCRLVVRYANGHHYRAHMTVLRHRHVKPGFTRMGWRLPAIPDPPG